MPDDQDKRIGTILAHADHGEPECCGLVGVAKVVNVAEIICNECRAVVRYVLAESLQRTLDEMEMERLLATVICEHCGSAMRGVMVSEKGDQTASDGIDAFYATSSRDGRG